MNDTCFILPKERSRLSALYAVRADKTISRVGDKPVTQEGLVYSATYPTRDDSTYFSGGAGLVSTVGDYFRFCQMMLNRGELDGARVLKPETVDRMTRNQIGDLRIAFPGNDLMGYGFGVLSEEGKDKTRTPPASGRFPGAARFNTFFWVDPKNRLIGIFAVPGVPIGFTLGQEIKRLTCEAMTEAVKIPPRRPVSRTGPERRPAPCFRSTWTI